MDSRGVLMLGLVVACMLAVSLIPRGEAEAVRDAEGCPYSGAVPTPENVERVREAILCLLNRERTRAGLPALVRNRELELASQLHSEDMGARDFYEHDTPDGIEPAARAEASGYWRAPGTA